jgi:tRNA-Thr(GGU) m(6)t(6)A37 methyltransferase TsaA
LNIGKPLTILSGETSKQCWFDTAITKGERFNERARRLSNHPIGRIRRTDETIHLEIQELFRGALKQLDKFSHVLVFWWADRHANEKSRSILVTQPPYAKDKDVGVFATRAEYRPNPIAMTACKIVSVDEQEGIVHVGDIDAYDGTKIIDLKAYFPVCDRVKDVQVPEWAAGWPEWMPEKGLGL